MPAVNAWAALQLYGARGEGVGVALFIGLLIILPLIGWLIWRFKTDADEERKRTRDASRAGRVGPT